MRAQHAKKNNLLLTEEWSKYTGLEPIIKIEGVSSSKLKYATYKEKEEQEESPAKSYNTGCKQSLDMIYYYASRKRVEKMRRIVENINLKLPTILRRHTKPTPNPLTT